MGYYEVFLSNSVDEPVSIFEPDIKELVLLNAKVMLNAKESGSFEFKMPPQHVFYDNVVPYGSSIEVFENGKSIFFGRPLTPRVDFWGSRQYHCEGALSFLNDVYLPPTDALGDSIAFNELLDLVLSEYNKTQTRFDRLMYCDLSEIPDTIIYEPEKWQYQSALNYLRDYMYQFVGGYFYAEKGVDWIHLRWKKELTEANNQPVEFGVNLLDMTRIGQPFYTAAIAKGGEDENGTAAEMVEPRYLPDDLRTTYGTIEAHLEYPHLTTQAALIAECDKFLSNQQFSKFTFEVHAADQHLLNDSYEEYRIGQLVKVHSEYQGINVVLPITSLEIDLNSAIKKPTIGDLAIQTLTISIKKAKQETEKKAKEDAKEEAKKEKDKPYSPGDNPVIKGKDGNDYVLTVDEDVPVVEKIPSNIKISPTLYNYTVGSALDLSQFTVTAYYGDGSSKNVTSSCSYSIPDGYVFVDRDPHYQLIATYKEYGKSYTASAKLMPESGGTYTMTFNNAGYSIAISGCPRDTKACFYMFYGPDGWTHKYYWPNVVFFSSQSFTPTVVAYSGPTENQGISDSGSVVIGDQTIYYTNNDIDGTFDGNVYGWQVLPDGASLAILYPFAQPPDGIVPDVPNGDSTSGSESGSGSGYSDDSGGSESGGGGHF